MKTPITREMSLKSIERAIEEELNGKELWGDIDFSVDDYEGIKRYIRKS